MKHILTSLPHFCVENACITQRGRHAKIGYAKYAARVLQVRNESQTFCSDEYENLTVMTWMLPAKIRLTGALSQNRQKAAVATCILLFN